MTPAEVRCGSPHCVAIPSAGHLSAGISCAGPISGVGDRGTLMRLRSYEFALAAQGRFFETPSIPERARRVSATANSRHRARISRAAHATARGRPPSTLATGAARSDSEQSCRSQVGRESGSDQRPAPPECGWAWCVMQMVQSGVPSSLATTAVSRIRGIP